MAKALPPLWFHQLFDNFGALLAGGKIYTYAGGTTTPLATFTDASGSGENTNPIILDSAGRADIFLTEDTSYKFVITDADDNVLETTDGIISYGDASAVAEEYEVAVGVSGTPGAQAYIHGRTFVRSVDFPANFEGAQGNILTSPDAQYDIDVQKNGVTVGTISIDTSGVFSFSTASGATFSVVAGDELSFIAPDSGSASDMSFTVYGDIA